LEHFKAIWYFGGTFAYFGILVFCVEKNLETLVQGCQIFFSVQRAKTGKIHPMTKILIKLPFGKLNECQIFQMGKKISTFSIPKLGFLHENIPSGNPALVSQSGKPCHHFLATNDRA
jgi:hypothetical protein